MKRLASILTIAMLISCGRDAETPPPQPDLQPMIASMEAPNGTLNPTVAQAVLENTSNLLLSAQLVAQLFDELSEIADKAEGEGIGTDKQALSIAAPYGQNRFAQVDSSGTAWARLRYKCGPTSGLGREENGQIVLFLLGEVGSNLGPIWGRFENCVIVAGDFTQVLTGDVAFLPGRDATDAQVTYLRLNGNLATDEDNITIEFEGSIGSGFVDFLQYVEEQTFVIRVPTDRTGEFGVRESRGSWLCQPDTQTCILETDDLEVSW